MRKRSLRVSKSQAKRKAVRVKGRISKKRKLGRASNSSKSRRPTRRHRKDARGFKAPKKLKSVFRSLLLDSQAFTSIGFARLLHEEKIIKDADGKTRQPGSKLLRSLSHVKKRFKSKIIFLAKVTISAKIKGQRVKASLQQANQVIPRAKSSFKSYVHETVPQGIFDVILFTLKERTDLIKGYGVQFRIRQGEKLKAQKLPKDMRLSLSLEGFVFA